MIAACPTCAARCRIDRERLPAAGARVRCPRCQAVFRVRPAAAGREGPRAPAAAPPMRTDESPPPGAAERERLVLVADAQVVSAKELAHTLADWGLRPLVVHDGVEAILTIQRTLPRVVVLDAALPKMFGFQICELMKRNDGLRSIHVVLVGAIHDGTRYRRPPTDIYGADAYVERPQLPEALRPLLRGFGLPLGGAIPGEEPVVSPAPPAPTPDRVAPEPAPDPAPAPAPERTTAPAAAPAESDAPAPDPGVLQAERLARIIVSDVVLYNQEKFDAAVRAGNVVEAMAADMQEGRAHFDQRIPADVRAQRDFLTEALRKAAETRGAG